MLNQVVPIEFLESAPHLTNGFEPEVYVTGATGYVGRSMIETVSFMREHRNIKLNLWISERDARKFQPPYLAKHNLKVMTKDLLLGSEIDNQISHIIYLANPHFSGTNHRLDEEITNAAKIWIENLVKYCIKHPSTRLIYSSSGAVYDRDKRLTGNMGFKEEDRIQINSKSSYAGFKLFVEEELMKVVVHNNGNVAIPRLFTFYGPNLPLKSNFLIGNLMQSVISNQPIVLKSNGTTRRSFMHSYEMTWRLLQILFSNFQGFINLGSETIFSVSELAEVFNQLFGLQYSLNEKSISESFYIPDTSLLTNRFGPRLNPSFPDSLTHWLNTEKEEAT